MSQIKRASRPFGEVNVNPPDRTQKRSVRATVPLAVHREGSQTGLAIDASGSMEGNFADLSGQGSAVAQTARQLCTFLAGEVDADGGTTAIYWALGEDGGKTQLIGDLTKEQAATYPFAKPPYLGGDTKLLPAARYFEDRFRDAPWGIYVIVTDGKFNDLEAVKKWGLSLAKDVLAGRRNPLKFVIIGVGSGVKEEQMSELDDLTEGTDLPDLWDHKLAADMRDATDIFAEVVNANSRVATAGRVLAPNGTVLKDFTRTGVPGVIEFDAPAGIDYFTLELDGKLFHQALTDEAAALPTSDALGGTTVPGVAPGTQLTKDTPLVPGIANSGGPPQTPPTQGAGPAAGGRAQEITNFDVTGLGTDAAAVGLSADTQAAPPIDLNAPK